MGWASRRARLNRAVARHLSDGTASYQPPHGMGTVAGIPVIVDHNLMQAGAEGVFRTDATGITWNASDLPRAARGGIFTIDCRRYTVEDILRDDGQVITAACMELQ